jgi:PHD/YefM family antitoxin component YafN of YafNO toxin-antitoxin module
MSAVPIQEASEDLPRLLELVTSTHEPIIVLGDKLNGVLVSEDDWKAIQETIYLGSIPRMTESIKAGMNTSIEDCTEKIDW